MCDSEGGDGSIWFQHDMKSHLLRYGTLPKAKTKTLPNVNLP